jgi:hypothetical protein
MDYSVPYANFGILFLKDILGYFAISLKVL